MKTEKIAALFLLTTLASSTAFAQDQGTINFSQDQIKKDPTFHCDIKEDKGTILSPTHLILEADKAISFDTKKGINEKRLDVSVSDTKSYYFQAAKDEGGGGTVAYHTENQSTVVCAIGTGGRQKQYTG